MAAPPPSGDKKNIVKMAYIYFQEGRWDKAIEEYKKLLALDPEDINTHNMLGDVYVKKGSPREAYEEYIKVSADFSSRGQSDKAAIVNKKIAALDSATLPAEAQKKQSLIKQGLKAELAMESGNVDEAIAALSEVAKLDSENLAAYAKLGELFEKKGETAQAVQQYQMLGEVFLKNRLLKKAQEMFQRVVALDANNVDARGNLAQIFLKQGSESDAKKEFLVISELALNQGDIDKANIFATKAVELKSIEAHYILGMVLYKKQKLSEAKAEFESLLRFKVNHVGALTYLGKVYLELNQPDKASENIQKALKIEKDNLAALETWAILCVKKGSKEEAATVLHNLIDKSVAKKDWGQAAEYARELLSVDDNSIPANNKLAEILVQTGDKNAAADKYFKIALIHEKQNKKEPMMEFVRKTLELNPGHTEAQKRMMGEVTAGAVAAAPPTPVPAPPPSPVPPKTPAAGVLDLEQEITKPPFPTVKQPEPVPVEKTKPQAPTVDPQEELHAQVAIADDYVKQGLVQEAIEIYQQLMESYPNDGELKAKLNQAYTAYVKTGDEVIGALEAEKKAKQEEDQRIRQEMEKRAEEEARRQRAELEQKARQEAEVKARAELEKKARQEAEKKAKEEAERLVKEEMMKKAREEAERKVRDEMEKKARDESDRLLREDMMRRAKEEAERKVRDEMEKKAKDELEARIKEEALRQAREEAEKRAREEREKSSKVAAQVNEIKTSRSDLPSKGDSLMEEGRDEFMTIAVADIYTRQGLYEEASKIYRRIVNMEPNNLEAKKKLGDLENLIKSKGNKPASADAAPPPKSAEIPPSAPPHPHEPEKDSGGKKKSNKVGYV
ncbi:MAG TPA: tetratricopeptide repeat protein [bacterium]|nr:tetratricopeptide repeat protein [bacterium]